MTLEEAIKKIQEVRLAVLFDSDEFESLEGSPESQHAWIAANLLDQAICHFKLATYKKEA